MKNKTKAFTLGLVFFLVSLSFIGLIQLDTSMLVKSEEVSLESTGFSNFKNATVISDDENQWNTGHSQMDDMAIDSLGNIHVVWHDSTPGWWGTDYEIIYCNYTAANGWSNATIISDDSTLWNDGYSGSASIAIDSSNNLHVVWKDETIGDWWGSDYEIMYSNFTAGATQLSSLTT